MKSAYDRESKNRRVGRLGGIDAARGIAIALMYLSHVIKSLLPFKMMPAFGIVPIHLITKFSSSLFILVFGITLAIVYLPKVGTPAWPSQRWRLVRRAILVMFWYKALIVVQMFERSKPQAIIDTLLWRRFPDFVEILQFYAWFLLLLPILLPLWHSLWIWGRAMLVGLFAYASYALHVGCDFWGIWQLKAVIVEHPKAFCFGVLTRGTMALGGLLLAEIMVRGKHRERQISIMAGVCAALGVACWVVFYHLFGATLDATCKDLALNMGKHPPDMAFMTFTFGGALLIVGACLVLRGPAAFLLWPFEVIGRESLFCFNFHILLIFIGYRYFMDLRHQVTYSQALGLVLLALALAVVLALVYNHIKTSFRRRKKRTRHEPYLDSPRVDDEYEPRRQRSDNDTLPDVARRTGN